MINDFEIISINCPNETATIIPISDVHLGAAEHLRTEWIQFCKKIEAMDNVYIALGGDLCNNATKSSVSDIYCETESPRIQKRAMVDMLAPIKHKILCAVQGNHERRSSRDVDDDITYDIMAKLDIEDRYRPNMAFIKFVMRPEVGTRHETPRYFIGVTHGSGGGALTGGAVNKAERFADKFDGLDVLIVGHTHKPFVTYQSKLKLDPHHNTVTYRDFTVVSCASWLAYGGYAVQKMLSPAANITHKIVLSGKSRNISVISN